ncbi:hypothetical protein DFH11DRAFT_1071178 [Phellopilus nigrolimitatus]|nr:hypothetical protein DFH11DRAFT_1071178 [Phellopilus nigrolimitatus]
MKTRLSLPFTNFARSYATRRPIKPPPKIIDPLTSSSQANIQSFPDGVTFVHRPPPTAPSPFSTTILPASPLLRTSEPSSSSPDEPSSSSSPETVPVPPRMRREREFPDNRVLTETDFAEMRELRAANPTYYTRTRLAKKFNCPPSSSRKRYRSTARARTLP